MALRSLIAAALLFLSAANAHFQLVKPTPLEGDNFNEELEGNAPCGGGVADLSKATTTDFHVDGEAVAVVLGHPQANWLIRATLDSKAASNWTQLFPIVQQSGQGSFCEPSVSVPKEWAGKKGFIGLAAKAVDGILYQCAAVNFVSGATTTLDSSTCKNGSAVSASFVNDAALTSLIGSNSTTASSPAASSTNAAPSMVGGGGLPVGSFIITACMILVGAALL